jgi:hypothetical protein
VIARSYGCLHSIKIIHTISRLLSTESSNVAGQRCQCRSPLTVVPRLPCSEVDSQRAELRGARGLRGARVDVSTPGDLEIDKTGGYHRYLELCVQQSAGDSALPQVDVLFSLFRHCFLNEDVAYLKAAARFEHTRHFPQSGKLVGKEIQHTV